MAVQTAPVEDDFDLVTRPVFCIIGPFVPDGDGARPVFAFGDGALKMPVFERVVFYCHGKMLFTGFLGDSLRESPSLFSTPSRSSRKS